MKIDPIGSIIHYISAKNIWPEEKYNVSVIIERILIPEKLSYHFLIGRSGLIYQLVPLAYRSFHAGYSTLNGRDFCNGFCFGVALVSTGEDFTEEQIESCIGLHKDLIKEHGIKPHWIEGHKKVRDTWNLRYLDRKAADKYDPGPNFPWDKFREAIFPEVMP